MTSACSGALDIAIGTLSNAGQNILTPSPGFALYRCLLGAKLVEQRLYRTLVSVWGGGGGGGSVVGIGR